MRKRVRLLNVDVDDITMDELVDSFREGLLLTLHVDMIMKLQQDREFYDLLPEFGTVTCDSQILVAAARMLGTPLRERVSGSDFFPRFYMQHKDDPAVTIFICGGGAGRGRGRATEREREGRPGDGGGDGLAAPRLRQACRQRSSGWSR